MQQESGSQLRTLLNGTNSHVDSLKALKYPVEHWGHIFARLTVNTLDRPTWRVWEDTIGDDTATCSYVQLTTFSINVSELLNTLPSSGASSEPLQATSRASLPLPVIQHPPILLYCRLSIVILGTCWCKLLLWKPEHRAANSPACEPHRPRFGGHRDLCNSRTTATSSTTVAVSSDCRSETSSRLC